MIENKKTYNGHTYSGVQLDACINGYQQGRADIIQGINNIFNKYTDIITTAPTRLVMCETKAMCLDDVMKYLLNQLEKEQRNETK